MKTIWRVGSSVAAAAAILAVGSGAAMAGTTYSNYSVTTPSFGGSGYTNTQTKASSGVSGDLKVAVVGGSYTLTAWMQTSGGQDQQQVSYINDNTTYKLPNNIAKGVYSRVRFANGWVTTVAVQTSGTWRSN